MPTYKDKARPSFYGWTPANWTNPRRFQESSISLSGRSRRDLEDRFSKRRVQANDTGDVPAGAQILQFRVPSRITLEINFQASGFCILAERAPHLLTTATLPWRMAYLTAPGSLKASTSQQRRPNRRTVSRRSFNTILWIQSSNTPTC